MSSVYEELCSWGVGNLKDFLSARGISCQGNKQQLVSRSYVAWENKVFKLQRKLCANLEDNRSINSFELHEFPIISVCSLKIKKKIN